MTESVLNDLLRRVTESGLIDEPVIDEDTVIGTARLDAAGVVVEVDLDPEIGDVDDPDLDAMITALSDVLSVGEDRWNTIVDEIASEIEDAVEEGEIDDQVDLRVVMEAVGVGVFADAVIVVFAADTAFPDALIHVQLSPDLEVEDIEVIGDEDEDEDEDDADDED